MRPTSLYAMRAVRMYAPMRVATAAPANSVATATPPSTPAADVRTARRLTESLLKSRAARKTPRQEEQPPGAPRCAPPQTPPPPSPHPPQQHQQQQQSSAPSSPSQDAAVRTAVQLALSYGKSAYFTHLTHQDDDDVYHRAGTYSATEWEQLIDADSDVRGLMAAVNESSSSSASTAPSGSLSQSLVPGAAAGVRPMMAAVESHWAALSAEKRVCWIRSTPQGRSALDHAKRLARHGGAGGGTDTTARRTDGAATASVTLTPSLVAMLSTYPDALVQPRQPRAAALAPPPPRASPLRTLLRGEGAAGAVSPAARPDAALLATHGVLHGAYTTNANCRHLRARADAMQAEERRRTWHETLVKVLGGEGAFAFAHDVKDFQQPHDDAERAAAAAAAAAAASSAPAVSDTVSSAARGQGGPAEVDAALQAFCEGLGIRSPRRAFVLGGVLAEVDAAASASRSPLTLEEVRAMATALSAEYDKLREEAAQTALDAGFASPEAAVRAFEREQLARAVDGVQKRMDYFAQGVPFWKNCVRVLSK